MRSLPGDSIQCDLCQEALSARLDGEREPVPAIRVDEHVATCDSCADWWRQAQAQAEALRLGSLPLAPMFHVELPKQQQSWRTRVSRWLRKPGSVELRAPEGARFGRKTSHLRVVEEPAE